jgi:hypothetical protein
MVCGAAAMAGDRVPEKIDIGPLYNVDPARRAAYRYVNTPPRQPISTTEFLRHDFDQQPASSYHRLVGTMPRIA